jgi:hypothetical protein
MIIASNERTGQKIMPAPENWVQKLHEDLDAWEAMAQTRAYVARTQHTDAGKRAAGFLGARMFEIEKRVDATMRARYPRSWEIRLRVGFGADAYVAEVCAFVRHTIPLAA